MTNRARFQNIMGFKDIDRVPRIEFASYWDQTLERWIAEGLDSNRLTDVELRQDFGLDDYRQFWIEPYTTACPKPPSHGGSIFADSGGYERIRKNLYPDARWDTGELDRAASGQEAGTTVIWITLEGFFWFPRYLLGIEQHLYAFYDHPELIHAINDELADYHCRIIEEFGRTCSPDFMTFAEDLSYNQGPMLGRDLYDEFLLPYYKRVIPELKMQNTLCFVDSDGLVENIIPWFEDAGFDGCLPCERHAGNDISEIRRRHPQWLMIGGIEKRALNGSEKSLRAELDTLYALAREGGYIPSVDHQTPPDVSIQEYRRYLDLMKGLA